MYRTREGRQRRFTIGRHGAPWTPETAREEGRRLLGEIVGGADPAADKREAREAMTVAELCDAYLADAEAGRLLTRRGQSKKASTLAIDRGRIERHFKPLLGNRAVAAVTRRDIEGFMHAVAEGKLVRSPRQDQAARGGACARWPRHSDPSGGVARRDLYLCREPRVATG
jgi:Arm DNA-binding domain